MAPRVFARVIPRGPSYAERNVVVVGGTSGLGLAAVSALAAAGAKVLLVARDRSRGEAALAGLGDLASRVEIVDGDVSSLASVRVAAAEINRRVGSVQALLCNAAVPDWRASSRGRTEEDLNRIFATNYLGHYLFSRLLAPTLAASLGRVVFIAGPQRFYRGAPSLEDLRYSRAGAEKGAYAGAKIACFCLAAEMSRRHPSILTAIIDPGLVATEFQKDSPLPLRVLLALGLFRNEPEAVGNLYAWLALSDEPRRGLDDHGTNALFVSPARELPLADGRDLLKFGRERLDPRYQSRLWDESAKIVGLPSAEADGAAQ